MKIQKAHLVLAGIGVFALSLQACKTKKIVAKPNPPVVAEKPVEKPVEKAPVEEKTEAPAPEKPDYNFSNVQFEFNSGVLKTASFQILDNVAKEMKKDTSVKFVLNGHSSAEGTVEHNMSLSVDRANSVKSYLVNAGINGANLTIKGFGATKPLKSNATEEGKELNRRVEIKVSQ
ncbi:OOP family OmpA-OmpF porin [Pedobacter cryoconitis]|uniref:OOP family OmpA-OmpF porin n=1 Tax=Pedobacter cryoconitis TaxID=188932 RepID=A0A7W8ZNX5_9SPHI|nr:OmpA family protein [Pedobacter cryoconitis]MBB5637481.1 OOP family OmpA-OmpF porin [Pedobacter cryoconitis]MBB6269908.1 OOP family OmpA-OmpF porin [Pedobacter cryoconitis]